MDAYDKIRAALELLRDGRWSNIEVKQEALAALAELERAAADLAISRDFYKRRCDALQSWQSKMRDPERTIVCDILANGFTLDPPGDRYTAPPPAPVAELREPVEVTQEMCARVAASFYGADTFANGVEMHEALQLWRAELGPTLGLVEIREPTDAECRNILAEYATPTWYSPEETGREMFRAVRAVMWPKGGES